jgi:hypothetical protein
MRSKLFRLTTIVLALVLTILVVLLVKSAAEPIIQPSLPTTSPPVSAPLTIFKIGVIGDYGNDSPAELQVSEMIKNWYPEIIITTGDNNYTVGAAETIDANIGKYFHEFIANYQGKFGVGADSNRFFPSPGNHDWGNGSLQPYLDYFSLPGNERYYDFVYGPIHFFALDSDPREPDGVTADSQQAQWLQSALANSTAAWQVVYFHHPPYSSGADHGSTESLRWPFVDWGADLILSGHEHLYERLEIDGIPYIINGLGGAKLYDFTTPLAQSKLRFNANYGAQLIEADDCRMRIKLYSVADELPIDAIEVLNPKCD